MIFKKKNCPTLRSSNHFNNQREESITTVLAGVPVGHSESVGAFRPCWSRPSVTPADSVAAGSSCSWLQSQLQEGTEGHKHLKKKGFCSTSLSILQSFYSFIKPCWVFCAGGPTLFHGVFLLESWLNLLDLLREEVDFALEEFLRVLHILGAETWGFTVRSAPVWSAAAFTFST